MGSLRTLSNKQEAYKRFFEEQQLQQQQEVCSGGGGGGGGGIFVLCDDEDCTKSIIKPNSKQLLTYGSLHRYATYSNKPKYPAEIASKSIINKTSRFGYFQNRIHRTSSLNRIEDLDNTYSNNNNNISSNNNSNNNKNNNNKNNIKSSDDPSVPAISDIIGSFGLFQMIVLLFSGLRESLIGYDALIMSVILQPESKFLCADNLANFHTSNNTNNKFYNSNSSSNLTYNETAQCYRSPDGGKTILLDQLSGQPQLCQAWIFPNETLAATPPIPSLVAEWSLVCQYSWLVAFIESAYFFGLMAGNLTWGYYADKYGRRPAYLVAHSISFIFGSLAVVMPSVYLFTLCRFFSAFGSIGLNIIYSVQVEIIGAKHRSFSTTLNHLGWGLGVICIPLVDHLFDDYRPLIALAPLLSLVMFPWALWLPESPRWLMANGHYERARNELIRAAKWNGRPMTPRVDKQLYALEQKIRANKLAQKVARGEEKQSYHLIFTTPALLRDTIILSYLAFLGHLYYYVQTISFAYVKNLSTDANFITSGAGEWISVIIGAILLKYFTRKTCMSLFLIIMACSFAFQSLIDSEWFPNLDTTLIITANNGFGKVSALLLVFVVLIVNQEVYPTVVRQTGTSITNTISESGSTLAPMLIQLSRMIGSSKANAIYTVFCALGILVVQFVARTDDIELSDT